MIFSNMEYPGKDYRVQVVDTWLGEEFEPMDNPQNGDKIVYRIIGENGQPVEQKTEVYQNGAWVEQGGGGGSDAIVQPQTVNLTSSAASVEGSFSDVEDGKLLLIICKWFASAYGEYVTETGTTPFQLGTSPGVSLPLMSQVLGGDCNVFFTESGSGLTVSVIKNGTIVSGEYTVAAYVSPIQ